VKRAPRLFVATLLLGGAPGVVSAECTPTETCEPLPCGEMPPGQVSPQFHIRSVAYAVNAGPMQAATCGERVKLQPGDTIELVGLEVCPDGPAGPHVAAVEAYVRRPDAPVLFCEPTMYCPPNDSSCCTMPPATCRDFDFCDGRFGEASRSATCPQEVEPLGEWTVELGWDRIVVVLIDYFPGGLEVDDRFFLNLQVGDSELTTSDSGVTIAPADPGVGTPVEVSAKIENLGSGLFFSDVEADVFLLGDGCPVWVGAKKFSLDPGEKTTMTILNNSPPSQTMPVCPPASPEVRWIPREPGTYLVTATVDPEKVLCECCRPNNFGVIGVEIGDNRPPPVSHFFDLAAALEGFEAKQTIRNSTGFSLNDKFYDGWTRSFHAAGLSLPSGLPPLLDATCSLNPLIEPYLDDPFFAFRALVAFGRVFTFDVATEILDDVLEGMESGDFSTARAKLEVAEQEILARMPEVGEEIITDSRNTIGDGFPFNPGAADELLFRRGTSGNVASILQAFFAYQAASGDTSFEPVALDALQHLLRRQVRDRRSAAYGLLTSRPHTNFAIVENNLRALDTLILAEHLLQRRHADAVGKYIRSARTRLEQALFRIFTRRGKPSLDTLPEAIDHRGVVFNRFTAQDVYTIGGVFLLRRNRVERAWDFIRFIESNYLLSHPCGTEPGLPLTPNALDHLPDVDLAGIKFFDGNDADCTGTGCCSILTSEPGTCDPAIDFDDPGTNSHQTEATLDYALFLHEFSLATHRRDRRAFAERRRDRLLGELVQLYNECSAGSGLPVSSRAIPNLFTSFDGSLASAEARILARILERPELRFLYRGVVGRELGF